VPQTRNIHAPAIDLPKLTAALEDWYRMERFQVQTVSGPDGIVVQAREQGGWSEVVGMSSALTVKLHQQGENLVVEIGTGKWADKAAAAGAGMLILWPLAVTAAIGAWRQNQLPERTLSFIESYVASGTQAPPPPPMQAPPPPMQAPPPPTPGPADVATTSSCGKCGAALGPNVKFCSQCGAPVPAAAEQPASAA
jgi:zinc-ribbon domain